MNKKPAPLIRKLEKPSKDYHVGLNRMVKSSPVRKA